MKKLDLSNISNRFFENIDKIGKLSRLYRILLCLGIFMLLVGPFVYFNFLPKMNRIDELKKENETLETKLVRARARAQKLKHFQNKLKEAELEFKVVRKKLPEQKEIPSLLTGISQSGRDAGLEFTLFQPKPEQNKDFYAEIPVSIMVTGNYHKVAFFFDKVARMSRIVNIDDIQMTMTKDSNKLLTSCSAVTYRFVETKPEKTSRKKKS
jgi:type IV pilus assembly protein PilO